MPDPRGGNPKKRPFIVLSADDAIRSGAMVRGIAVSSTFTDPLPPECVELPWHPQGRVSTGFRRRSVAVCNWAVSVPFEQVQASGTFVTARVIQKILDRIAAAVPPTQEPP
jgi:hypothetical protein